MKKKNLFFIPLFLGIIIVQNGCFGDVKNSSTIENMPAVVTWDDFKCGTTLGIFDMYIAAPSLTGVSPGDCLFLKKFTFDYDNQPSREYLTATEIVKEDVAYSSLEFLNSFEIENYTLPILNMEQLSSPFYHGYIFIQANCRDENPELRLIYDTSEQNQNNAKNIYLIAKPSLPGSSSLEKITMHAFNLKYLISSEGRDTTIVRNIDYEEPIALRYIKLNINFFSKLSDDNKPEYKNYSNDILVYLFK